MLRIKGLMSAELLVLFLTVSILFAWPTTNSLGTPTILLNPSFGPVGTAVTVTGSGFSRLITDSLDAMGQIFFGEQHIADFDMPTGRPIGGTPPYVLRNFEIPDASFIVPNVEVGTYTVSIECTQCSVIDWLWLDELGNIVAIITHTEPCACMASAPFTVTSLVPGGVSLFSDAVWMLPLPVLAGAFVVRRWRRKRTPVN